jgi:hypothetical protein
MENIQSTQVVLLCSTFNETVAFFKDRLGFRVEMISPTNNPSVVIISEYELNIRLKRTTNELIQSPGILRFLLKDESGVHVNESTELSEPNGTKTQLVKATQKLSISSIKQSFVVSRISTDAQWVKERAGMNYRDLIPGRQDGRFIASHIQISDDGPVADYVHYHNIRFQMIYVYKGWARLVYEDQGDIFILRAEDCITNSSYSSSSSGKLTWSRSYRSGLSNST